MPTIIDTIGPLGQARPTMGLLGQARALEAHYGHYETMELWVHWDSLYAHCGHWTLWTLAHYGSIIGTG